MCKFCKFTNRYVTGEKDTYKSVLRINDGSQAFEVILFRNEQPDGKRCSRLVLNLCVRVDNSEYVAKEKDIEIKYCPFCGEEL